jgi:hypothetical protein
MTWPQSGGGLKDFIRLAAIGFAYSGGFQSAAPATAATGPPTKRKSSTEGREEFGIVSQYFKTLCGQRPRLKAFRATTGKIAGEST